VLQAKLEELEAEILEVNGNSERLARSYNELVELQLVLEKAGSFFDQVRGVWAMFGAGFGGSMLQQPARPGTPMTPRMCAGLRPDAPQARIDAQAESFDRTYSVPEAMDAPLLESALPVSLLGCGSTQSQGQLAGAHRSTHG
jgi:hypothetical protein